MTSTYCSVEDEGLEDVGFENLEAKMPLTSNGCTSKHDGLEPHGEKIGNSKIAS